MPNTDPPPIKILIATSNPHKIDEIRAVWSTQSEPRSILSIEWVGLNDIDHADQIPEPIEDQPTFEANARLKARHYAAATGMLTIADDSGLEVDCLDGHPGVRSARYAGATGPRSTIDAANNDLLLNNLKGIPAPQRAARFVCAMALCAPPDAGSEEKPLALTRGTLEGRIIGPDEPPRGDHGFGYDPLFFVLRLDQTTAQLSPDQKNAISHRGAAARIMWQKIQELGHDGVLG